MGKKRRKRSRRSIRRKIRRPKLRRVKKRGRFLLITPSGQIWTTTNVIADMKRKAKRPGKRKSKRGKIYYEYRSNRSDVGLI